jgi:hypothetical protein
MRGLYFLLLLFIGPHFCFGQRDSIIETEVRVDNAPPQNNFDSVYYYSFPDYLIITFMEGFNDSVFVYHNGKCVDSLFLVTNESIGYAGQINIGYCRKETIDFAIRFKSSGAIIKERLNLNFKHLEIARYHKWILFYSNHFPKLE